MNTSEDLSQAMAQRVAGSGPGVPLEQVIGRAHAIRRRRRAAAAGVGVAAVVAAIGLAGPIASMLSTAPGPGVSKDGDSTGVIEPKRSVIEDINFNDLRRGPNPDAAWVERGNTLVFSDPQSGQHRATVTVAVGGEQAILQDPVRVRDGWLTWIDDGTGGREMLRVNDSGKIVDRWPTSLARPDLSPNGQLVAYAQRGSLIRESLITGDIQTEAVEEAIERVSVDVNGFVYYGVRSTEPTADSDQIAERVWGSEGTAEPTALSPVDVDAERGFLHLDSVTDEGSCSSLRSWTEKSLWQTCEYRLQAFSPDGRWIVAGPAYADGYGPRELAILDASTGEPLISLVTKDAEDSPTFTSYRWEDDAHLLVAAVEGTAGQLLRVGIDGSIESASELLTTDEAYGTPVYQLGPGL